ncbi:ABC transporter substrate-binding protein [Klenkia terrae]|uniref:ABC transporter substrate-binding protein n=2 Tax=Klenkia terrae TaxID=1052259 RepID=A0ABU8E7K0_9ACTN|nr:ABC transporter substrate-binding protein [Klenkia terrae]SSC23551.1 Leucine-binding protein [Klenkia terrae]
MRTHPTLGRTLVLGAVVLLAASACGSGSSDTDSAGASTADDGTKQVNVYGADGNMNNGLGEDFADSPGALAGMRGTVLLTDIGPEFRERLLGVDPSLTNFNTAAETYDAVVIASLAAQLAGSNEATVWGPYVNGVTFGGEACTTFAECSEVVAGGGNPDYDGVNGPLAFTDPGEPSVASFAIESFTEDGTIDEDAREFVQAGDIDDAATDEGPAPAAPGTTGAPLVIGSLTPQTGSLAYQGPQQIAALTLAVTDVNAAGGVLGNPVQLNTGDSGDASTDTATQTADRLLQQGANVIVGASSSGVTLTVIDAVTQAGVAMISPASTSDRLTDYADNGLFFRTVPPDTLQARALADLIGGDGNNTVGILALNDPYGTGLADNTAADLISDGLDEDSIRSLVYDPTAANFDSEVSQMVEFNPDAILVIGFEETSRIIEGLNAQGIGPQR